jgi:ABC-type branched-subunit amino acid transport system permease subunit
MVGHHGLFSLTPFVALSVAGVVMGLRRRADGEGKTGPRLPSFLFPLTAALSAVVIGFYLFKSDNYGGWTNGPRWLMWLTPLWLLTMLPAVDWLARSRWGRALAGTLLVVSILSVSYMAWNPWRHPWIYTWMDSQGWIPY